MLKLKSAKDYVKIAGPLNFPSTQTLNRAKNKSSAPAPAAAAPATAPVDPGEAAAWEGLTNKKMRGPSKSQIRNIQEEANMPSLDEQFAAEEAAKLAPHQPAQAAPEQAPATPADPAQAMKALQTAIQTFRQSFTGQVKQLAPLLSTVNKAIAGANAVLRAGGQISPEALNALSSLTATLQNAVAEESQDEQLLAQLIQQAQAVSQQIGDFQQFMPQQQNRRPAPAPAAPPAQAPQQATPQQTGTGGAGWGKGIGTALRNLWNIPGNVGRGWQSAAEGERPILTAAFASARAFVKVAS